ncbi:hypothetical protein EC890511_1188, partial [Escherichia coli 89.0511]
PRWRW